MADEAALVFDFQGQAIRVAKVDADGSPWFVAKDVCTALNLKVTASALRFLPGKNRGGHVVITPGGKQTLSTVNEGGLYKLIFKSEKKEAVAFADWVTEVVLPSIRKTGSYSRGQLATVALQPYDQLAALVTQLTALVTQLTARKPERSINICQGEVRLLKAQARGIARREGRRGIRYLWNWIRESNDLDPGPAFSTVPRVWFPSILEELRCRGRRSQTVPATSTDTSAPTERASISTLPNNLPPISEHRSATTADFGLEEVARKLSKDIADLGFEIPISALHRIGGIYEVTGMDLLYLPLKGHRQNRAPYLDATRYAHVLHWVRANSEVAQYLIDMHRRMSSGER